MKNYTSFTLETMKKVSKAINCIPCSFALRNEAVKSIDMIGDDLRAVHFSAMTLKRVVVCGLGDAWLVDNWSTVYLEDPNTKSNRIVCQNTAPFHTAQPLD